jgi:hypothetical protein
LLALLDIVLTLLPVMKLESDFVGELDPEAACEAGGVTGRLVVAIAFGRNLEADRPRKEDLMLRLYRFVAGLFD